MPDAWETAHGLNAGDASDRNLDPDRDGLSNWQEYIAGTDPQNGTSVLKAQWVTGGAGGWQLSFTAMPNVSYCVQYQTNLRGQTWPKLADIAPRPGTNVVQVSDPGATANAYRFYRVVTPQQP
jgi:hypothetical protein